MARPTHALVVGCGIAGPALALAFARQGIRSTVVETRARTSEQGGSITLARAWTWLCDALTDSANALLVLDKALGVYDRLREIGFSYTRVQAVNDDGYVNGAILNGQEPGYPCVARRSSHS